ncbi:MAG: hypothetical protein ACUVTU_12420 [Desulfurispora sp.]|uniref:hypothetical protein n=1 Tax=Desulfurispora sp. TaxID=3014275 RepID=UPI0040498A59
MLPAAIDTKKLSQKYRVAVPTVIRAWKMGLSDQEICLRTGIHIYILHNLRQEIALLHRQARLKAKNGAASPQASRQRQIILSPFI